ncbi:acyl carrier protein [Clostridium cavendishii DSM 21758]|uniref:Acyl carrier protein n=1 Tax=Clostridium cavendishii DSM 21758 TaxID=1121302 RepID=A0A1M6IUT0_9CLOT|nr:peptide maturation system acyl carrier-related protein [Clostridium cavendishii]SHJ38182.1 acyl carrier protein [Clostridium cavendishii DSM 21758]
MNKIFKEEDIKIKLKDIFINSLNIDPNYMTEKNYDSNLLGNIWRFTPRDLVYLFFEVEEKFFIKIPEENIINGDFKTFNNIVKIINKQLNNISSEPA